MSKKFTTIELTHIALFAVLIAVCSWITIPTAVPFTMQTFGVFCALSMLGAKKGTIAIVVYILMGAVGVPVFSNFQGSMGALFGLTGGYILGFLFMGLTYGSIMKFTKSCKGCHVMALMISQVVCYAVGTLWFVQVYSKQVGDIGIASALLMCVIPFIIPDLIKLFMALWLTKKLKPFINVT